MPERIRLRRTKGWRKPAGAVVVTRPTRWGNPFKVGTAFEGEPLTAEVAVRLYREALEAGRLRFNIDDVRRELRTLPLSSLLRLKWGDLGRMPRDHPTSVTSNA